jgi:hypothetical protein
MQTDRHEVDLSGVRYATTAVETGNGHFYGFWYCQVCHVPGSPNQLVGSIEDAHEAARSDLESHHVKAHGPLEG